MGRDQTGTGKDTGRIPEQKHVRNSSIPSIVRSPSPLHPQTQQGTGTCGVGGWTHGFLGSMIDRSIWCHLPTHSNLLHHVWGRFNAPNRSNPSSIFWIRLAPYQNRFFLEKTRVSRCWRPYAFATAAMFDFFLSRLPAVEPFTTNISCVYTDNINENSCEKWYHGEGGGLPRLKQKGIPSVEI